ncbi:hypothetical protein PanWU01x14_238750 [Parasponia andersonii]|uniref:TRF2/HOY1 PH-like domain-containing protein n=1 Tax=Parasponia andersonii TaxID=3476 RepID=A0A2P5BHF6_PARAD|nr:hypothetical protein PanWU01x14_238750 [Parasponia andersonii]
MDPSNNSNNGGNDQSHIRELANQRLRQTPIKAKQQKERIAKLLRTPSLGLKHNVNNQPLLGKLNKRLYLQRTPNRGQFRTDQQINNHKTTDSDDKPSHVDASFIRIGTWKRVAQNSKDLVAKIYFGKRRLVWEILERGLKSKIEIQWESIVGMRLFLEESGSIIFEVELSRPPLFCKEIYPLPMRHTLWDLAPDFTDGQAKTCK